MSESDAMTPVYDDAAVARIRSFVERITGGRVVRMDQQVRWRPAWFADVEKDGEIIELHLRGDRAGDVAIFPDLKREADIIRVLGEHGVPVPRIHGYCSDPPCIVMESIKGSRDMAETPDEATRAAIGREYMAAVARMHSLPVEPFAAIGMDWPKTPQEIALVGLAAYLPHYERTKRKPEPLLEFVIAWLRRNVPVHRVKAGFIQFDSGQFLVEDGKMTRLYDFEFSMIGDPMVDIATMGMRDSYEPLGSPLADLCRYYEAAGGEKVDHDVVKFHVLQFAALGTMQFAGTVAEPAPADPHSIYLMFDLSLRQVILLALGQLLGLEQPELPPLPSVTGANAALIAKLADTVAGIKGATAIDEEQKRQANDLIEWVSRADQMGAEALARDLAEVSVYLGQDFADWPAAEAALEAHVRQAGPERDAALFRLFSGVEGRRMQVFGPTEIGGPARHVTMPPTR